MLEEPCHPIFMNVLDDSVLTTLVDVWPNGRRCPLKIPARPIVLQLVFCWFFFQVKLAEAEGSPGTSPTYLLDVFSSCCPL